MIAAGISGWLFIAYLNQRGPVIQISFDDASGIQVEKTQVRFRGVSIGAVKKVSISPDLKEAIVSVALRKDAENFAVEGSKFWMVLPKVDLQGVSGLETLFEGVYIAIQPGPLDAMPKDEFKGQVGLESDSLENTIPYFLEASSVESISIGDSVTFRGLKIGAVTKVTLSKTSQFATIQINVQNRYSKLIRTNTVFWRKVGIQANLGLFNSEVKVNSIDSILHGGIDLFTPDQPGDIAKSHSRFALVAAPPKGWEKWNPKLELETK
jgi:paraquat-inducible protein B